MGRPKPLLQSRKDEGLGLRAQGQRYMVDGIWVSRGLCCKAERLRAQGLGFGVKGQGFRAKG
jgi:hypothetical protein